MTTEHRAGAVSARPAAGSFFFGRRGDRACAPDGGSGCGTTMGGRSIRTGSAEQLSSMPFDNPTHVRRHGSALHQPAAPPSPRGVSGGRPLASRSSDARDLPDGARGAGSATGWCVEMLDASAISICDERLDAITNMP